MNRGDRFHARGMGPRWPEDAGRRCRVREVTWTARDESAQSRVLQDVTEESAAGPVAQAEDCSGRTSNL